MSLALLLACSNVNSEPRFQKVNDTKVRRIFGIPLLWDPVFTELEGTLTLDFEVQDRERDEVRILVPHGPPGLVVDEEGHSLSWTVPADFWEEVVDFEVIAIDEHGANEVLFLSVVVEGVETDTAWLPEEGLALLGYAEVGDGSEYSEALTALYSSSAELECWWVWENTRLLSTPTDCEVCDYAWEIEADAGATMEGDCSGVELAVEVLPPTTLGYASVLSFYGYTLTDVALSYWPPYGWVPLGDASVEDGHLEWVIPLPED